LTSDFDTNVGYRPTGLAGSLLQLLGTSHLTTGKAGGLKLWTAQSGDSKDYL